MAWESRKRGAIYYTRSRKVGGRVVREYVGGGLLGQFAAATDAEQRAKREAQAKAWRAEAARLEELDASVEMLDEVAEALARGALMLAGYHRHHRGEWRRKREKVTHFSKCEPPKE